MATIYYPQGSALIQRNTVSGSQVVQVLNTPTNAIFYFDTSASLQSGSIVVDSCSYAPSSSISYTSSYITNIRISNPTSFGGVGDGTTDDSAAILQAYNSISSSNGILSLTNGHFNTTESVSGLSNNISPLAVYSNKPAVLGIFDGNSSSYVNSSNPTLWVQKFTNYSRPNNDYFGQNIGAGFFETLINWTGSGYGSGVWNGILSNTVMNGVNRGTPTSQSWSVAGSPIGVSGFAESKGYPGNGSIITALWGYAVSPTLDATTYANLPAASWSTVGLEINIKTNHPDIGKKDILSGNGTTVGTLMFNYQASGSSLRDWTFGGVFTGMPINGNFTDVNVANWCGFHTCILLDKIKDRGILFGTYMSTASYGIEFPSNFTSMSQRPKAGIYLGDTTLNMGEYYGATWNNGDFWNNGGNLYFRNGNVNYAVPYCGAPYSSVGASVTTKIPVNISGVTYYLLAATGA
jgi:hypothetical protein